MYSEKLFNLCKLDIDYLYHFNYFDGEYDRFHNCLSKEHVLELYEKVKKNPQSFQRLRVYKVDVKRIDFTEAQNFVKLLKIFSKHYTVYNNWFKGNDTFENNFLYNLTRKLELDWQFKKVRNIIEDIKKEKWIRNKISSYFNDKLIKTDNYIKKN